MMSKPENRCLQTPKTNKSPRPRLTRSARRAQLLKTAQEILLAKGTAALTVEGLARTAKIAKTVVYSHFDNASEVMLAVLEDNWSQLDQKILNLPEASSYDEFLKLYLTQYVGQLTANRMLLRRLLALLANKQQPRSA